MGAFIHELCRVARQTRETGTLLVTDGVDNKLHFMIRLMQNEGRTIEFEVNKSNLHS